MNEWINEGINEGMNEWTSRVISQEKENIIKIEDASGEVVMVMEKRESEERGSFVQGKVVLRVSSTQLFVQIFDKVTVDL